MESCKHRRTVFRSMAVLGFTAVLLAQPVAPASAAAPAVRACNLPYPPGEHTLTLQSGGLDRAAIVYVPSGYDGRHRLPLVLTLHGSQSDAAEQLERSELASAAEQHTFIVAAPQGYLPAPPGYRWNVPGVTLPPGAPPDDELFLSDLIDYLQATLCVDAKRIYGTGYSGGGRMISQYACDYADRLAAIAPVAGLRAGFGHDRAERPAARSRYMHAGAAGARDHLLWHGGPGQSLPGWWRAILAVRCPGGVGTVGRDQQLPARPARRAGDRARQPDQLLRVPAERAGRALPGRGWRTHVAGQ